MFKDLKGQFVSTLLFILTIAAVSCAIINFHQQSVFHLPDDGVTWVDRDGSVVALHVERGAGAANGGIHAGDVLLRIQGVPIRKSTNVAEALNGFPIWSKVTYLYRRNGVEA